MTITINYMTPTLLATITDRVSEWLDGTAAEHEILDGAEGALGDAALWLHGLWEQSEWVDGGHLVTVSDVEAVIAALFGPLVADWHEDDGWRAVDPEGGVWVPHTPAPSADAVVVIATILPMEGTWAQ